MADQEKQAGKLSRRDKVVLRLIHDNHNYREIGHILGIRPETARSWASQARKHFAELQDIPLESLNLDERHSGRRLRITPEEQERLNAYFEAEDKKVPPLPPDFESTVLDQLPGGKWAQSIEQERQTSNKRQR